MAKINPWAIWLAIAGAVIVILLGIIFYQSSANHAGATIPAATTADTQQNSGENSGGAPAGSSTTTAAPGNTTGGTSATSNTAKTPTKTVTQSAIYFITPVENDLLKIATQNTISWNRAGGISGELDLYNAQTKTEVGVILPQVGSNQTSYTWNTRDILLSRTSPFKTTVTPGNYEIRLTYDSKGSQPAFSPSFTITN